MPLRAIESDISYSGDLPRSRWGGSRLIVLISVAVVATVIAFIIVRTNGNVFAATAVLMALIVLFLTCYRIEWGFYLFVGMVLIFDQLFVPGFDPITLQVMYFRNLKEISYLPQFSAAVVNPMELQLFLIILVWFLFSCFKKDLRLNRIPMWGFYLLFYLMLGGWAVYGMKHGGDFMPMLWELRALFYLGIVYALVPQIIQTRQQLRNLAWVIILAISVKAAQACERFIYLGFGFGGRPTLTTHEDPLFMLYLVILLISFAIFGVKSKQRRALLWLLPMLLMGFFAGQRRATYAAIIPMLIAFVTIIPAAQRKLFLKTMTPILIVIAVYFVIFWNSDTKLASPVKLVKSGMTTSKETSGEHYYSNLYREIEKYDLAVTTQQHPLIGIGFGNKYEQPLYLVPIDFSLRDYIPHNEILWIVVKTGGVGFAIFWLFFNSYACSAASVLRRLRDPYLRALCALPVVAIVGQMVVSYYDLQLTFYRNMVLLGTIMGMLSSIELINKYEPSIGEGEEKSLRSVPW